MGASQGKFFAPRYLAEPAPDCPTPSMAPSNLTQTTERSAVTRTVNCLSRALPSKRSGGFRLRFPQQLGEPDDDPERVVSGVDAHFRERHSFTPT
jgi:hypothetical protein